MVAPEEVGFLHYSRNGSRNAENNQEMDDAQDVKRDITNWRDALKTVLLWKQKHSHKNTYLILIFLYFGCSQVLEKTSQSVYPYLCPSHCLSANECDLKAVWNSSSYFTRAPQQKQKLSEINIPAGCCPNYDRKQQQQITPRKVKEKNGIIYSHKKLLLVKGLLRLLHTPKLVELYPTNVREIIKASN